MGNHKSERARVNREPDLVASLADGFPALITLNTEFLYRPGAGGPKGVKLGLTSEQKTKRKPRKHTSDKEKLDKLYKKVEKSASTGQGSFSQKIEKAEKLEERNRNTQSSYSTRRVSHIL